MTEPQTKAGQRLLDDFDEYAMRDPTLEGSPRTYAFDLETLRMWVAAIEAEAAAGVHLGDKGHGPHCADGWCDGPRSVSSDGHDHHYDPRCPVCVTLAPSLDEGLLARAFQSWMGDDGKYSRPQARYVAAEYRRLAQEGETST